MKGHPPFGYDLEDKKLIPHPINSEWVVKIFDWYDNGKSTYWIKNELFQCGVKPVRSSHPYFPRETINKLLRNKNYIGIDTYKDLSNECPILVDKKIFYSVQSKFSSMRKRQQVKNPFLLRGIIKCSDGTPSSCVSKSKTRKHDLYSCVHKRRKQQRRNTMGLENCNFTKSIRTDILDEHIWNTLCDTLFKSHRMKEKVRNELVGNKSSYTTRTYNNKIKLLTKKMYELENNRLELEKKYYIGEMDKKRFDILNNHIQENIETFMKDIKQNEMKLDSLKNRHKWIDWMEEHNHRINEIRSIDDYKGRLDIIKHYVHEISVLDYDKDTKQHTLTITFRLPLFEDSFEWLKNKDDSFKLDRNGKRRFQIVDGKVEKNYKEILPSLLNGNDVIYVGFLKPYLTISFKVISHMFSPNQFVHRTYKKREPIHKRINQLIGEGLGYRRIHKVLVNENWEVGTSPTCIDTMIRKMKRREFILSQPTITEYDKMEIQVL